MTEKKRWQYFAYGMTGFTGIMLVLILWSRKSIKIAIAIIKEASSMVARQVTGTCV